MFRYCPRQMSTQIQLRIRSLILLCVLAPSAVVAADHAISLPENQTLLPAGLQVELPGLRPQVLALSPNGKLLVTSGKTDELIIVAPNSGKILQHIAFPSGLVPVQE